MRVLGQILGQNPKISLILGQNPKNIINSRTKSQKYH